MITKLTQGGSFTGAIEYVMGKPEAELIGCSGVRFDSIENIIADFETMAKGGHRAKRPCVHISCSFHKKDSIHLNSKKMQEIGRKIITGLGFKNCQCLIVRHKDTDHQHFHIVLNRIDFNGKCKSVSFIKRRLNELRKAIELEYPELTKANGKNLKDINISKLRPKDANALHIYNCIQKELKSCTKFSELIGRLKVYHGIDTQAKYKRGDDKVIEGIKFCYKGNWISGSKVDKSCSFKRLGYRLAQNKAAFQAKYVPAQKILNATTQIAAKQILKPNYNAPHGQLGIKKTDWTKDRNNGMGM